MRIQETDRILKESRFARQHAQQESHETGVISRVWQKLTGIFRKQ